MRGHGVLKHRMFSGILFGGGFLLAAAFVPVAGAWVVLTALSCLAQLEFYRLMTVAGIPSYRIIGLVCGASLITATFWTLGPAASEAALAYKWENLILIGTLLAIFVRQFPQKHNDKPLPTIACTLLGIWYVPFMANFLTRLVVAWEASASTHISQTGRMLAVFLVVVVKSSDIGAYFVGMRFGRHKLFPRISPAKSWEGFVGGNVAAVGAGFAVAFLGDGKLGQIPLSPAHTVICSLVLAWAGVVGDLFESLLKRASGVKDSGWILPGMGGLLDVLDSLLFAAPVLYVYVSLFLA